MFVKKIEKNLNFLLITYFWNFFSINEKLNVNVTLLKEFIKIDVIFDNNKFAKVSAIAISKIMINFNENKFAFIITISKKNDINNFD